MNTLKRSFEIIEALKNVGSQIDAIRLNNSGFSDDESECIDEYKCLGGCFQEATPQRVYFANNPYRNYTAYSISEMEGNKKVVYSRYFRDYYDSSKMRERLEKYRKPAQFGDISKEETRVDETVRKGFDITLAEHKNIKISEGLYEHLRKAFVNATGMNNVEIVPYKINIYQPGDFFKPHRDSPAKNLIATIVVHIEGEKEVFKVDNTRWDENYNQDNDFCFFFTDVLHEVTPVNKYRETLTFKVFKQPDIRNELKGELSPTARQISQRINLTKPFGVLLQHGYTYMDVCGGEQLPFKGLDEKLVLALRELGVEFNLSPVIVKDQLRYKDDDSAWERGKNPVKKTFSGEPDEICNLYIYNVSDELYDLLGIQGSQKCHSRDVYYLGMGFHFGEHIENELYIGNEYNGTAVENIYVNLLLWSKD